MFIKPMKAHTLTVMPESEDYVAEPKWDGWRCLAGLPSGESGPWLESSTGTRLSSVPYINTAFAALAPLGTILDGEVVSQGGDWNQVQTVLSRQYEHVPTDESPAVCFVAFDLLVLDGTDLRGFEWQQRRELLETLFRSSDVKPVLHIAPTMPATKATLDQLLELGFEGVMVKHRRATYSAGKRPQGAWYKIKAQDTEDVVVTGFKSATEGSKYDLRPTGPLLIGAIEFVRDSGVIGRCSGMTDEVRAHMTAHKSEYVGQVMELAYNRGATAGSGKARHPNFVRMRDPADKGRGDVVRPARTAAAEPQPTTSKRNYDAMKDDKLLACIDELRTGGDAAERADDPRADLRRAIGIAEGRGLTVPVAA